MLDLALHLSSETTVISAREIAERQELSPKYLESLLVALRAAGLVRSVRGAQGGYTLARDPAQISLREIYHVFERKEPFVECTTGPERCNRSDACVTQEVWSEMYNSSMEILESTAPDDLARRVRQK